MVQERLCAACGRPLPPNSSVRYCAKCLYSQVVQGGGGELPTEEPLALDLQTLPRYTTQEEHGRYANQRQIARGGMGRILLAHDGQLGRDVVLKELFPSHDSNQAAQESPGLSPATPAATRFYREAQITAQLEHPSVVPVHELGCREDGTLFYTMKHVRGVRFSDAIRNAGILGERLRFLPHYLNLCQAIAYAHSRGVIHRDIKPGNVMVGEFGETVLLDWGLAKPKSNGENEPCEGTWDGRSESSDPSQNGDPLTRRGDSMGTPHFMAPEQARGHVHLVDERSDVYSLGATLYNLITGRPPYLGESAKEIVAKVLGEEPTPINEVEPNAPPELVAICEKAMAREPEDRYSTAYELANEIQRFLSGGLVDAYTYHYGEHFRRFFRRNKGMLCTAGAAALALSLFALFSYIQIFRERNDALLAKEDAEQQEYYRTIALAVSDIERGETGHVAALLETCPVRFRGWEWGYLYGRCRKELLEVQAHSKTPSAFAVSADATRIASLDSSEIVLFAADSLRECWRMQSPVQLHCVAFHPDGKRLLVGGRNGLDYYDVESGRHISTPYSRCFDMEKLNHFSMKLTATGVPPGRHSGSVNQSGRAAAFPFEWENGTQIVRLHLGPDPQSAGKPQERGPQSFSIRFSMEPGGTDLVPAEWSADSTRLAIDWIAISDDPGFVPAKTDHVIPTAQHACTWTFDTDTGAWYSRYGMSPVLTCRDGQLLVPFPKANGDIGGRVEIALPQFSNLRFSRDGMRLFALSSSPSSGRGVFVFNTDDWSLARLCCIEGPGSVSEQGVGFVAASSDSGRFLVMSMDGNVVLIDTSTWQPAWEFDALIDQDRTLWPALECIAFDKSENFILTAYAGTLSIWNIQERRKSNDFEIDANRTYGGAVALAIHPLANKVLCGYGDGYLREFLLDNGTLTGEVHSGAPIVAAAYTDTGDLFVSVGKDGKLSIWSPDVAFSPMDEIGIESEFCSWGISPKFTSDGNILAFRGWRYADIFWDMRTMTPKTWDPAVYRTAYNRDFPRNHLFSAFRPGTDELVFLVEDRAVFCRSDDLAVTREFKVGAGVSFCFDSSGRRMALACSRATFHGVPIEPVGVQIIDVETGETLTLPSSKAFWSIGISKDGSVVAAANQDGDEIEVWSVEDGTMLSRMVFKDAQPWCVAMHPQERVVAVGCRRTGRIGIWDFDTGALIRVLPGHPDSADGCIDLDFTPDGLRLFSAGAPYTRIWDWSTGQELMRFRGPGKGSTFSPDGQLFVSDGVDPLIQIRAIWPRSRELWRIFLHRRQCQARMLVLDDAKMDWAIATAAAIGSPPGKLEDILPYANEGTGSMDCPGGGVHSLNKVGQPVSCSLHGVVMRPVKDTAARLDELRVSDTRRMALLAPRLIPALSDYPPVLITQSWTWAREEKHFFEAAIVAAQKAVEIVPDDWESIQVLGFAKYAAGYAEEAVACFREAYEKGNDYSDFDSAPLHNLVLVLLDLERYKEAETVARESLETRKVELAVDHPAIRSALADLCCVGAAYRGSGQYEEATRIHRELLAISTELYGELDYSVCQSLTNLANAISDHAKARTDAGDPEGALALLEEALVHHRRAAEMAAEDLFSRNGMSVDYIRKGRAHADLGQEDEARKAREQGLDIVTSLLDAVGADRYPDQLRMVLWAIQAQAMLELGRVEEARPIVSNLLEKGWNDATFLDLCRKHGLYDDGQATPSEARSQP